MENEVLLFDDEIEDDPSQKENLVDIQNFIFTDLHYENEFILADSPFLLYLKQLDDKYTPDEIPTNLPIEFNAANEQNIQLKNTKKEFLHKLQIQTERETEIEQLLFNINYNQSLIITPKKKLLKIITKSFYKSELLFSTPIKKEIHFLFSILFFHSIFLIFFSPLLILIFIFLIYFVYFYFNREKRVNKTKFSKRVLIFQNFHQFYIFNVRKALLNIMEVELLHRGFNL